MAYPESVRKMWKEYHDWLGIAAPAEIPSDSFSDNPAEETALAALVNQGIKRATASAVWAFEQAGAPLPKLGGIFLVVDGEREAVCIVKTTKVSIIPFNEISEADAYREGEGDRSLAYWRRVHIAFYQRQFKDMGLTFSETMPIAFEEFEKVFPVS